MSDLFVLTRTHAVRPARNMIEWAQFMSQHKKRIVEQTETKFHWVSTVFIGINYRFMGKGPPVVFETMTFAREHKIKEIFGRLMSIREEADLDFGFGRWCFWDEALTGHHAIVGQVLRVEAQAETMAP